MEDMKMMNEMTKLAVLLAKEDIPFELVSWSVKGEATTSICSPSQEDCIVDAVCHQFSYGGQDWLLEVMGSANPELENIDVVGYLTAEEAIKYFRTK